VKFHSKPLPFEGQRRVHLNVAVGVQLPLCVCEPAATGFPTQLSAPPQFSFVFDIPWSSVRVAGKSNCNLMQRSVENETSH